MLQIYLIGWYNARDQFLTNFYSNAMPCLFVAFCIPTVPMYAVDPIANPVASKGFTFSIDGPQCTDPASCYPVGVRDVTNNIQLNNDASHILPGSFIMAGFLEDFKQGIWDIPSRSLSASSSTAERAYTPSYIMMPPGTAETYELADWIARNTELFDPEKGAVSAALYRFDTAYDLEDYPYCSIPSANPLAAANVTTRGCISPYSYSETYPTMENSQFPAG